MKKNFGLLISFAWLISLAVLAILSYTQVDLNLTLINWKPYLDIQKQFTQLGYFNRGLNGNLFSIVFVALVAGYAAIIKAAHAKWISLPQLKKLALTSSIILLFSYTVFSHDLFNYIFDARIITLYHQNPYAQKALDYPSDDWIRFMQWTHRTYPYGPSWLIITLVPSLLGFAKLLPTYLLFKAMFVLFYNLMLIYFLKILEQKNTKAVAIPVCFALLAFNPLILVDGLVSSRIDLVMASLAMIALYYHLKNDNKAYLWMLISACTKFATFGFIPVLLIGYKRLTEKWFFCLIVVIAFISVPLQILLRGLQPWYFILPMCFIPLLYPYWRLRAIFLIILACLLPMTTYLHLIYTGISKDALWFL